MERCTNLIFAGGQLRDWREGKNTGTKIKSIDYLEKKKAKNRRAKMARKVNHIKK